MPIAVKIGKIYSKQRAAKARRRLSMAEKRRNRFDMRLKIARRKVAVWKKFYRRALRPARKAFVYALRNFKVLLQSSAHSVLSQLMAFGPGRRIPNLSHPSGSLSHPFDKLRTGLGEGGVRQGAAFNGSIWRGSGPVATYKLRAVSALLIVVMFGWSGFFDISLTAAYFSDNEASSGNTFTAASLDFSVESPDDFAPQVTPDDDALREAALTNDGSLGFTYKITAANFSGDAGLCGALDLSAALDGGGATTEPLPTFETGPFDFGAPEDWDFTASLTSDDESLQEKTCGFDLVFSGWQMGMGEGMGFSDTETISASVSSGTWAVDACAAEPTVEVTTMIVDDDINYGSSNVVIKSGGELKSPTSPAGSNGVLTITTTCDITVESGGKITARKGDNKGGTLAINARNLTVESGGIAAASAAAASGKDGGTATITLTGDLVADGSLAANGDDKGGTVDVDAAGSISVSGSSLTATGTNKGGGNILLSADGAVEITGLVSVSGKEEGGSVNVLSGGSFTIGALGSVLAESTNKKGGEIMVIADGMGEIDGKMSADGKEGDGLVVMTVQGDLTVGAAGLISAISTGTGKDGGTIGIKVGGDADYSGTVRANAAKNAKTVALWSEGATTIAGTVSATGGLSGGNDGGTLDITVRGTLSGSGVLDATGSDDGVILLRTVTNGFAGTATPAATTETITLNNIVLNEIIPDPVGSDPGSSALPLDGEWVELYNKSGSAIDVAGWVLRDADGNTLTITAAKGDNDGDLSDAGETIVPAGGTLTVYRNGATGFTLNDAGDTVQLLTDASVLVDSFTYVVDVGSGNSIARMPDGSGAWVDPEPTPTALNGEINLAKLRVAFLARLAAEAQADEAVEEAEPEQAPFILSSNDAAQADDSTPEVILEESEQERVGSGQQASEDAEAERPTSETEDTEDNVLETAAPSDTAASETEQTEEPEAVLGRKAEPAVTDGTAEIQTPKPAAEENPPGQAEPEIGEPSLAGSKLLFDEIAAEEPATGPGAIVSEPEPNEPVIESAAEEAAE